MTTSSLSADAQSVMFTADRMTILLRDGRELSVLLAWFPRLQGATTEQRAAWRLIGAGEGIHWEALDEDISVPHLLGYPASRIVTQDSASNVTVSVATSPRRA